jgi:hypothetical protein
MHLVGPYLSTTSIKKRVEKITKAKQQELEQGWRERNQRLKEMRLPKESFDQYLEWVYGRGKKTKTQHNYEVTSTTLTDKTKQPVSRPNTWTTGACALKTSPKYTGTEILGIATMHKSNMVPVFSNQEAKDISTMRRG